MDRLKKDRFYINTLNDESKAYDDREKTMLLVVDIQPKLMKAMENGEEGTLNTIVLEKAFNQYGMHLLATEQYPKGLGHLDERISEHIAKENIFEKTSFNAYTPEVADYIEKHGITNVLITGAEGHVCVYQTARSLLSAGLNVFMVEDAINSYKESQKDMALESLRDMGAVIVNTELVLFDLAVDSKDPHFKFISNLVKEMRDR